MYRGRGANRGAKRGGGGGHWGRGGRGGNRGVVTWYPGASRGAYRGKDGRNATASFADRDAASASAAPQRLSKPRLMNGCYFSKQIFRYFNPSAADYHPDSVGIINSGEDKPDGASFALIYVNNQPNWMAENTIRVKSRLHLLPEYADKKALLLAGYKELSDEELKARISATLTESIKFGRYGIEDGPDVEIFEGEDSDGEDNIAGLILPGEWMSENHEGPEFASVDTPSVMYAPAAHDPIAVFAGYGNNPDATGFKFVAWFLIEEIELFAPNSVDLARKMRDEKWAADIGREWAIIKLLRVGKSDPESRPAPHVGRGRQAKAQSSEEKVKEDEPKQSGDGVEDTVKEAVDVASEAMDDNPQKQDSEGKIKEGQSEKLEDGTDTTNGTVEAAAADSDKTTARDTEVTGADCDHGKQAIEDQVKDQAEKPEDGVNTAEYVVDQDPANSDKTTAHLVDETAVVCDAAEQASVYQVKEDKSKQPNGGGEDAVKEVATNGDKTMVHDGKEAKAVCDDRDQNIMEEGEARADAVKVEDLVFARDKVVKEAVKNGDAKGEDAKGGETKVVVVEDVREGETEMVEVKGVVKEETKEVVEVVMEEDKDWAEEEVKDEINIVQEDVKEDVKEVGKEK